MAVSKCPKCNNSFFELSENSPSNSRFKFYLVQCSSCGSVVGVTDFFHVPTVLDKLEKKIDSQTSNSDIIQNLNVINQNIARLFNAIQATNNKLVEIENKVDSKK